jgi:hypothetical protein
MKKWFGSPRGTLLRTWRLENFVGADFSLLLTKSGISDLRPETRLFEEIWSSKCAGSGQSSFI